MVFQWRHGRASDGVMRCQCIPVGWPIWLPGWCMPNNTSMEFKLWFILLVRNLSSKCFIPHRCGWLCCVALSRGQVAFTSKALCEQGLCIFSGRNSKSIVASDAMHPGGMAIPAWWGMQCIPRGRQSHSGFILFWRYDNARACLSRPRWQRECLEWHEISATTGGCDSRPQWRE